MVCIIRGLPKTFATLVKINRKYLQFFLWSIFDILLATAGQQNNTFSCTRTGSHHNSMAWYSDCILNTGLLLNFLWQRRIQ